MEMNWLGEESMYICMEDWLVSPHFDSARSDIRTTLNRGFRRQQMGAAVPFALGRGDFAFDTFRCSL
jgi:hypothetical protein